MTVTEVYEFLRWLNALSCIIEKAPSAGLFDGQTDEQKIGITNNELDAYRFGEKVSDTPKQTILRMHNRSEHKREGAKHYVYWKKNITFQDGVNRCVIISGARLLLITAAQNMTALHP